MTSLRLRPLAAPLLLLGLSASACSTGEPGRAPDEATGSRASALLPHASPSSPLAPAESQDKTRWAGQTKSLSPGVCPPAPLPPPGATGEWKAQPLFAAAPTHPTLGRYCLYVWNPWTAGSSPDPSLLPSDAGRPPSQWLTPDRYNVAILGPEGGAMGQLPVAAYDELQGQQLRSLGAQDPMPDEPPKGFSPAAVAVVDTLPTAGWDDDALPPYRSHHGLAMTRIVDRVACPKTPDGKAFGPCAALVRPVLGLPMLRPGEIDREQGGYFGSQLQLAAAVVEAVESWKQQLKGSPDAPRRLVLNLSVGWLPSPEELGSPEWLPMPAEAVYAALRHASCLGALPIAAAGNAEGTLDHDSGPMLPAAWEAYPSPSTKTCESTEPKGYLDPLGGLPVDPAPGAYAPLVHAVGAVDGDDLPINNTRRLGTPRLVAPGAQGVGIVPAGTRLRDGTTLDAPIATPTLTGTSVSAAFASGAASTVWAYAPWLAAADVMALLYQGGADLSSGSAQLTEFPDGAPGGSKVHRAEICGALALLCESGGGVACEGVSWCQQRIEAHRGEPFGFSSWAQGELMSLYADAPESRAELPKDPFTSSVCSALAYGTNETPITLCPNLVDYGAIAVPWVDPQPADPGCGRCMVTYEHDLAGDPAALLDLYIYIDTAGSYSYPSLAVTLYSGERLVYDLGRTLPDFRGLTAYRVLGIGLPDRAVGQIDSVALTFTGTTYDYLRPRSFTVEMPMAR